MTHHVFGHVNRDESLPVVDGEIMADKVRGDHGLAAPGLDGFAVGSGIGYAVDFSEQLLINVGAFLERTWHGMGKLVRQSE